MPPVLMGTTPIPLPGSAQGGGASASIGGGAKGRAAQAKTLDMEHTAALRRMAAQRTQLQAQASQLQDTRRLIAEMEARRSLLTDDDCAALSALHDRKYSLEATVAQLTRASDEVDYFVNTAHVLFRYYDIMDKGVTERPEPAGRAVPAVPAVSPPVVPVAAPAMVPVAPTVDPQGQTVDPVAPVAPTVAPVAPTVDPAAPVAPTVDPAAPTVAPVPPVPPVPPVAPVVDPVTRVAPPGARRAAVVATPPVAPRGSILQYFSSTPTPAGSGTAPAKAGAGAAATAVGGGGGGGGRAGARGPEGARGEGSVSFRDDRATLLLEYLSSVNGERPPPPAIGAAGSADAAAAAAAAASASVGVRARAGAGTAHGKGRHRHAASDAPSDRGYHMEPCEYCGNRERTVLLHDGYCFCNACYTVEYILVDHDKPSYKDPPKEVTYFAYKRINHFNEWLNQVQGKETTDIPDDVYDMILLEIKKQKITNMADLNYARLKGILKKMRIHKFYEHVLFLIKRLNGLPIPHFSAALEDKLRSLFCQIQVPFLKHSPPTRKNFLSYSFVLHKMMQLLEQDQFLNLFPLLKSREKLAAQDAIWKNICAELGWQFVRSL
jgi:hypothetical protein